MQDKFIEEINNGYKKGSGYLTLGSAVFENEAISELEVTIPLKMFNRHGLIAGATGTGKTKTLQKIAENLSENGVGVLLMDIKGDLSGLSQKGQINSKIEERINKIKVDWQPTSYPTEFLSLNNDGVKLRATVTEFGPILFSRILELNDTQTGIVALIFKYCDDNKLPLVDLKDFKKVLQFLTNEGKAEIEKEYGRVSSASTSTIIRKIIEIEGQGASLFFGEKSFEVDDLLRINEDGLGYINILRLNNIQDKPKLFSTFMLSLLAEIYATFPEEGDLEQPKLVIFIDEAHLIFNEANKTLLTQLETIIKLIRSKGVGLFFCTQLPTDIPSNILSQLGSKIQHALRAFTANDRKAIKLTAENYPISEFYKTDELLTNLGIGEALISVLNDKGNSTPLVHCMMAPPKSRMDIISQTEFDDIIGKSDLVKKYNQNVDGESAYEMLSNKLQNKIAEENNSTPENMQSALRPEKSIIEKVSESPVTKIIVKELARGLLGALGLGSNRRSSAKNSWFK